jgi:hypothetical protein
MWPRWAMSSDSRWLGVSGLGLARWEAACRRQRIMTVDDGRLRAKAVRARPAVEAALSARERVVAEQANAVLAARSELAKASKQMARFREVGASVLGLSSAEILRLGASSKRSNARTERAAPASQTTIEHLR